MKSTRFSTFFLLIGILGCAAWLRWSNLAPLSDKLCYDEAYYGLDTLSLLESPRLTPFLPANNGRQSGWCYFLMPFVAAFGATPFALRLASTIVGILTVAATYRLARELLPPDIAVWGTLSMAVLPWHIRQSYMAMRATLFPFVGVMALATILRAFRLNQSREWIKAGIWVGLLMYTYYSALAWILYICLLLGGWWIWRPRCRRGLMLTFAVACVLFLPMAVYAYLHPQEVIQRPAVVAVLSAQGIWNNLRLWGKAWFGQVDPNNPYFMSGPAVPSALILPFIIGVVLLPLIAKRKASLIIVGLGFFSFIPSLISDEAPHFMRAVGLSIPIAFVIGTGLWGIATLIRRWTRASLVWLSVFPSVFLAGVAGLTAYQYIRHAWAPHPQVFIMMEQHVNEAVNRLRSTLSPNTPVYFSPFSLSHPVIAFRRADLAPRPVGAFDSHLCLVIPERPAVYVSVTLYEPDFQEKLSRWAETTALFQDPEANPPRYTVWQAVPKPEFLEGLGIARAVFGDRVEVRLLEPLPPTAQAGETVPIHLALRARQPLDRAYSLFVHLYGDPTPYEGGPLWAQTDGPPCEPYPSDLWRTDEWVLTTFSLALPEDLPSGRYQVGLGIYDSATGARLPLPGQAHDFLPLQPMDVYR